jgi:Holliday junction resolvasome RuvABC endonuclease subunit
MQSITTVGVHQDHPSYSSSVEAHGPYLLSIDPGSKEIGWALLGFGPVYHRSGVELIPDVSPTERIGAVGNTVSALITCFQPNAILMEVPNFIGSHANPQNLITYFLAAGAAWYAASLSGRRVFAHRSSANQGNQAKALYKSRFREMVGRPPIRDDESDAFCFGIAFLDAAQKHGGIPPGY